MVRVSVLSRLGLMSLLIVVGHGNALAQRTVNVACPSDMYRRAEAALARADDDWNSLLKHQRVFAPCDDGAMAEGYSEIVVTKLADHWDRFGSFAAISKRYPAFRRWAIGHIDASASEEDLKKIILNARKCAGDLQAKSLCATVRRAAADALSEQRRLSDK